MKKLALFLLCPFLAGGCGGNNRASPPGDSGEHPDIFAGERDLERRIEREAKKGGSIREQMDAISGLLDRELELPDTVLQEYQREKNLIAVTFKSGLVYIWEPQIPGMK